MTSSAVARRSSRGSGAARKRWPSSSPSRWARYSAARAVAARLEHAREQLLGGLAGLEIGQRVVLARQHEPRLQLEQRGDQDEELGGDVEVELAAGLEEVEIADDDVGQLDLEQVDLLAEDEREQQVERAAEDLEVQLELGDDHARHRNGRPGRLGAVPFSHGANSPLSAMRPPPRPPSSAYSAEIA